MDIHVLLPLDDDHQEAGRRLADGAATAAGIEVEPRCLHISLLAVHGSSAAVVHEAMAGVARATRPLVVRAHGFGFFCDGTERGSSIHVPIVCGPEVLGLHRHACEALEEAGAPPVTWTDPHHWSPHVTLLDHGLDAVRLGKAIAWLAHRHHPRWSIPLYRLVVGGPQGDTTVEPTTYHLGGGRAYQ